MLFSYKNIKKIGFFPHGIRTPETFTSCQMVCKDCAVQLFTTRSPSASILRTRKIDSLFVRTLHRYCRGHGLESCSSRTFFSVRLKFHSHISCVNRNCHDQSFLRLSLSYCSSVTELKICVNTTHIQF